MKVKKTRFEIGTHLKVIGHNLKNAAYLWEGAISNVRPMKYKALVLSRVEFYCRY